MWRDLERTCDRLGVPFGGRPAFPRSGLLAARVACLHHGEAWLPAFVRASTGELRGGPGHRLAGGDRRRARGAGATSAAPRSPPREAPAAKERLRARPSARSRSSVFARPDVYVVGDELFWGQRPARRGARVGTPRRPRVREGPWPCAFRARLGAPRARGEGLRIGTVRFRRAACRRASTRGRTGTTSGCRPRAEPRGRARRAGGDERAGVGRVRPPLTARRWRPPRRAACSTSSRRSRTRRASRWAATARTEARCHRSVCASSWRSAAPASGAEANVARPCTTRRGGGRGVGVEVIGVDQRLPGGPRPGARRGLLRPRDGVLGFRNSPQCRSQGEHPRPLSYNRPARLHAATGAERSPPRTPTRPALHHLCFRVLDEAAVDRAARELRSGGRRGVRPPPVPRVLRTTTPPSIADPDGIRLELCNFWEGRRRRMFRLGREARALA